MNISPYLFGNQSARPLATTRPAGTVAPSNGLFGFIPSTPTAFSFTGTATTSAASSQWLNTVKRVVAYLAAILIVLFILLLLVHFFVRPVFRWRPGTPGFIPVPFQDDGVLFWDKGSTGTLPNAATPIATHSFDYTLQMDIFIYNPVQFHTKPRLLFARGGNATTVPTGDTLYSLIGPYNLAIALKPDTTDMIVSVLNTKNESEQVIIPNVPIQETFRLVVVVMEKALEVYMNGRLLKTRTFQANPADIRGDIRTIFGTETNVAKFRNLKLWPRILTTGEIKETKPPLATAKEMDAGPIPSTSATCQPPSDTSA